MENEQVKVTAYITRKKNGVSQLLVFLEQGFEHLGLQVPGGTVEPGEDYDAACLREIKEEAGIGNVKIIAMLGMHTYFSDSKQLHTRRCYYQLAVDDSPDKFSYTVQSNDEDNGWIYHYFWVDVDNGLPQLFGHLGQYLDKLEENL